jgi:hypothetical protein
LFGSSHFSTPPRKVHSVIIISSTLYSKDVPKLVFQQQHRQFCISVWIRVWYPWLMICPWVNTHVTFPFIGRYSIFQLRQTPQVPKWTLHPRLFPRPVSLPSKKVFSHQHVNCKVEKFVKKVVRPHFREAAANTGVHIRKRQCQVSTPPCSDLLP